MSPFVLGWIIAIIFVIGVVTWITFEHKKIKWYVAVSSVLAAAIVALLFAEFSPGMGNTWLRINDEGKKAFNARGAFTILLEPLTPNAIWLWTPQWWFMNVYVLTFLFLIPLTYIIRI
jgi:hypothetical protein